MRKTVVAVALLFAVSSQSQQPRATAETAHPNPVAAPPPLVEKIDVSVVNVDVTVTDRRGNPVAGLTRNDFEILEDGKPQPVTNFYAVENAQAKSDVRSSAGDTDAAPPPPRYRRKVLVLIDNLNSTAHGRNVALDQMEQFVDKHFNEGHYDWSIATVDHRVHLVLPMTSDRQILHDVVAEIRRGGTQINTKSPVTANIVQSDPLLRANKSLSDAAAEVATQHVSSAVLDTFNDESGLKEQTMFAHSSTDAIIEAARAFGSSEGRKIILLVTGYLPLGAVSPVDGIMSDTTQSTAGNHIQDLATGNRELSDLRERLVREANASNTSFYIISSEGLEVPDQQEVNRSSSAPRERSDAIDTSAMFWLAKQTGGAYMPGNRIDESLVDFDRRSATFYSLGYTPQHPDDTRYHRLVVRVKGHSDYQLQYREGYSSAPTDMQITRTLRSPLGAAMQPSTMQISLIVGDPQYRGVVALVPLKAAMSMESLQYITDARGSRTRLHVYVSIFDSDGRNITVAKSFADIAVQPNESATGPMTITIPALSLSKGTYKVVVAVRDELTDHVGVATQKIQV
ncbi:MAG TPA: VWA domain-containing protein [Thermoanaerobaculia bacterium]|jgi:VWFA-related protein|nr:VWA domain-containing protein [Thermoanaerobaculia bacterium]